MPGASTPLTDHAGQHIANTSMSPKSVNTHSIINDDDEDDNDLIAFPGIDEALAELDQVAPKDEWFNYEPGLHQYGINYVDGGELTNTTFLEQEVNMPPGLATRFQLHCARMANRARKGKGRQLPVKVKDEGNDENNPISI